MYTMYKEIENIITQNLSKFMKFNPSKFKIIDQKKFVKESFIHKYKRLILTFLQIEIKLVILFL